MLGSLALAAWVVLALSGFWACRETDDRAGVAPPAIWPEVVAVVPARNEADVIARSLSSLAAQDYPGPFLIVLVDDNSTDATGDIARALGHERITVLSGAPLAEGWTGKLWAVHQGIAAAGAPRYLWLTDADIEHAPDTLTRLVGIAGPDRPDGGKALVSFMALLHCGSWAERALVPAFVWFFMMLYPFNWINRGRLSGAAGGCVLVNAEALVAAGGIAAMRGALIDDCALGALIKRQGPIWLGLTRRSRSIRPYGSAGEIAAMIARSAYAQLRYNPLLLAGTVLGLGLLFAVPPGLALFGAGDARWLGAGAWALMGLLYRPMMRFYRRSALWGLALPAVAGFYVGCTLASALAWYRGKGGMWKGRAQAHTKAPHTEG
jgi:hopene-associated glycosyltransferase HpnB